MKGDNMNGKYLFHRLIKHTSNIELKTHKNFRNKRQELENNFQEFSHYLLKLENTQKSLENNVRKMLAARFINHIYSALLLLRSGLISNALICERAAIEVLALEFLVRINPKYAIKYNNNKVPKPSEIRNELKKGGDFRNEQCIKDLYKALCEIAHISRNDNNLSSIYIANNSWQLNIGGDYKEKDTNHMLEVLLTVILWFVKE